MLNNELHFLSILDAISASPLNFLFQDKQMGQFQEMVFKPVLQGSENLKQEYESKQIAMSVNEIKSIAEDVARKHNVTQPFGKKVNKYMQIFLGVTFGGLMVLYLIGYTAVPAIMDVLGYVSIPALVAFCGLPMAIRYIYPRKWLRFVDLVSPEVEQGIAGPVANVRSYVQSLIYDLREKMLANGLHLDQIQFRLLSNQYKGLKLVKTTMEGSRTVYDYEFERAPGIASVESRAHDEFASFVIKEFEGEHIKEYSFNYLPKDKHEKVNGMLDATNFTESKQAHEFNEEINEFNLKCVCGEPLVFEDCQLCNWQEHPDFHFFFATGRKCKCKEVTYLFCADPKDVPAELKDIFI